MAHPLSGANPGTLATVMGRSGLPSHPLQGAAIGLSALARWPFSTAERLIMDGKLPKLEDMPAPVFILGHWRSGTTHLYNIMCESGEWGYVPPVATGLPWDLFGLAKVFNPLLERALPKHRYIDNIPVTPTSPQEDEIAIANMSEVSFYHGIYFPKAFAENVTRGLFFDGCTTADIRGWRKQFSYFLRKLYLYQDEKPLLIKNPVYTGRFAMLKDMFPDAKFIHIHRNPYDVFVSMRNFYKKLLKEFALQGYDHVDIDETILSVYERMMTDYLRDAEGMGPDKLVELRYDELDADPMASVETVYDRLGLPGFEAARGKFEAYLASVATFEKNKFDYSDEAAAKVEARLKPFIDKWDYRRPGRKQEKPAGDEGKGEGAHGEDAA
ncbi:sulfotransferase family protein [Hyphococcus luteus]|uniref:Sulfotransferase n=1 Tax=Hyphococcus luteus TaxID=2058213 RepID=A0A2S7JZ79_9PROT|nr:sulfotransferase [Marinicaulis flavus]PQA85516.1 sulfotransferase [Marinicaulis flavus]